MVAFTCGSDCRLLYAGCCTCVVALERDYFLRESVLKPFSEWSPSHFGTFGVVQRRHGLMKISRKKRYPTINTGEKLKCLHDDEYDDEDGEYDCDDDVNGPGHERSTYASAATASVKFFQAVDQIFWHIASSSILLAFAIYPSLYKEGVVAGHAVRG